MSKESDSPQDSGTSGNHEIRAIEGLTITVHHDCPTITTDCNPSPSVAIYEPEFGDPRKIDPDIELVGVIPPTPQTNLALSPSFDEVREIVESIVELISVTGRNAPYGYFASGLTDSWANSHQKRIISVFWRLQTAMTFSRPVIRNEDGSCQIVIDVPDWSFNLDTRVAFERLYEVSFEIAERCQVYPVQANIGAEWGPEPHMRLAPSSVSGQDQLQFELVEFPLDITSYEHSSLIWIANGLMAALMEISGSPPITAIGSAKGARASEARNREGNPETESGTDPAVTHNEPSPRPGDTDPIDGAENSNPPRPGEIRTSFAKLAKIFDYAIDDRLPARLRRENYLASWRQVTLGVRKVLYVVPGPLATEEHRQQLLDRNILKNNPRQRERSKTPKK